MTAPGNTIEAQLGFSRSEDVRPDEARDDGVLRLPSVDTLEELGPERYRLERCSMREWGGPGGLDPSLHDHGFTHADLSGFAGLQAVFERVRRAGRLESEDIHAIRRGMVHRSIPLGAGARMRLFFVAREGFIMRCGGPNEQTSGRVRADLDVNDHEAALTVHVDQDIHGTPVRQILKGLAPWLFHHDAPTSRNHRSPLFLVNVWVPLQQITRPLVLGDRGSLDRRAHQVRFALPTQQLFERSADRRFNDIWAVLHHPDQRWYFNAEMNAGRAYVFETLSTPHGACILPGEAHAEQLFLALGEAAAAIEAQDALAVRRAATRVTAPAPPTTAPLTRAMDTMQGLLDEAAHEAASLTAPGADPSPWLAAAAAARDAVVRKSIEMRALGWVTRPRSRR